MEMESTTIHESMSKKIWKLVSVALVMVKKGLTKSKLLLDVALLLKRSHKLAGKTLHSLILSSSNDAVRKADYEFSCSSSPAFPFLHLPKRGKPSKFLHFNRRHNGPPQLDEAVTMAAVQRVLEMINADGIGEAAAAESPAEMARGARQLRITDSPFPVRQNEEEAVQVSKAADDFINKFYTNLRMEKSAALDTPYHDAWAS